MRKETVLTLKSLLFSAFLVIATSSCTETKSQNKKSTHTPTSSAHQKSDNNNSVTLGDINDFSYLPTTKRGTIYKKANYAHSYSAQDFQSEWVVYLLTKKETEGDVERSNEFATDPTIPNSPTKLDYNQTGYDRGHQAPAADMKFTSQAMEECFYMTNMSPQEPSFNRGIWKDLEEDVRAWCGEKESIYVVTGALFEQDKRMRKSKITVPSHFYKILFDPIRVEMVAFLLPNQEGEKPMSKYAISVDDLEKRSGIDFFPQLADSLENRLETSINISSWYPNQTVESAPEQPETDDVVYVCSTSKGMKYHKKDCSGLKHCRGITISYPLKKAKEKGYSPCGTCY